MLQMRFGPLCPPVSKSDLCELCVVVVCGVKVGCKDESAASSAADLELRLAYRNALANEGSDPASLECQGSQFKRNQQYMPSA
jgi:hypothetical protein